MKAAFCLLVAVVSLLADDPKLGVVNHDGAFEFTVIFPEPVDRTSMLNPDNYQLSAGQIQGLRETATNQGVILSATGLNTNMEGTLTVTGILTSASAPFPNALLPFNTGEKFWISIGDSEIPSVFAPEVTSVGTNGFDLFSSGIQQIDDYEEVTFVGERVEGDFDYKTRVEWIDPAGAGAKAGIMVRENLDEGRPRPLVPSFSRYIELAISSRTTATGSAGNTGHQIYRRAETGDFFTDSLAVTNDAAPSFPNAWLRMQRAGDQFKMYRGTNGLNWQQIGATKFPSPATNALYVGIAFSPQNDDLPPNLKRAYVAKFRNFSGTNSPTLRVNIARVGDHAEVSWTTPGILQTTTNLPGGWIDAPSQANPQTVSFTSSTNRFYQLRR